MSKPTILNKKLISIYMAEQIASTEYQTHTSTDSYIYKTKMQYDS